MIITCPSCNARYVVDPAKIGASGRTVKCAKCGHSWAQAGVEPDEEAQAAEAIPSTPEQLGEILSAARAEQKDQEPDDEFDADFDVDFQSAFRNERFSEPSLARPLTGERRSNLPAVRRQTARWPARLAWLLLIVVVAGVLGGGLLFQADIVATWPASKRLYDLVGLSVAPEPVHFGVRNVSSDPKTVNGKKVLHVTGELVNLSKVAADAPNLRVKFFDEAGRLVMNWRFPPPERRMLPGESAKFETDIADPPPTARRIDVGVEGDAS